AEMRKLIKRADVILPNVTEACFLTDTEYKPECDEAFAKQLAEKLTELTSATIIVTGVEKNGKIGELILNGGKYELVLLEKLPEKRHGTGDIFASVFTAKYLGGESLAASCAAASAFVIDCLKQTDPDHFYGVNFEKVLNK
ncbi:MAG: bifunctional hydroxymethylpyrimidine kinase/phosphomethylpyrimidine kinase, partial [Clostridia bacterium]|nr:bifunctional hydroxymethylpyrimidine kinase/phosphomethylpyrimidine kinase [Clostridia bacterium]